MKVSELYHKAIEVGMKYDPRGEQAPLSDLEAVRKYYTLLEGHEKEYFDKDLLWNPYPDSRPVVGEDSDSEFNRVMVCLEVPNTGVALQLKPNLMISHHPDGIANAGFHRILDMQVGIWQKYGVRIDSIDEASKPKSVRELYKRAQKASREDNWAEISQDLPDSFRVLGIPWIIFHTAADNCVASFLQGLMDREKPTTLQNVVDILMTIPEYRMAASELIMPRVVIGDRTNPAGRIAVDMTGEESPEGIFLSLGKSGISTILAMHFSEEFYNAAGEHQIQAVCAGHASSDNLGMNLLLDEILPEDIDLLPNEQYPKIGGFRRFSHKNDSLSLEKLANHQF